MAGLASPAPLAQLCFFTATGVTGPNWDAQGLMSRRDENILDFGDPKLVFHCLHPVLQVETCPSPRSLPSLELPPCLVTEPWAVPPRKGGGLSSVHTHGQSLLLAWMTLIGPKVLVSPADLPLSHFPPSMQNDEKLQLLPCRAPL